MRRTAEIQLILNSLSFHLKQFFTRACVCVCVCVCMCEKEQVCGCFAHSENWQKSVLHSQDWQNCGDLVCGDFGHYCCFLAACSLRLAASRQCKLHVLFIHIFICDIYKYVNIFATHSIGLRYFTTHFPCRRPHGHLGSSKLATICSTINTLHSHHLVTVTHHLVPIQHSPSICTGRTTHRLSKARSLRARFIYSKSEITLPLSTRNVSSQLTNRISLREPFKGTFCDYH